MSIAERAAYGEALALIKRHGMVAVTEEQMQRLLAVAEAADRLCLALDLGDKETRDNRQADLEDALAALERK